MDVAILGGGYVGTTVAACLADLGHAVTVVDVDEAVVESIQSGEAGIHEPGLDDLVATHAGPDGTGRLRATADYGAVAGTDLTLVCLPTPRDGDGSADLSAVESGARSLGAAIAERDGWHSVVVKSTVPPGTVESVVAPAVEATSGRTAGEGFGVASNPEFLREGSAVEDFLHPDRIVLGTADDRTLGDLRALYDPLVDRTGAPVVETTVRAAETAKYASNATLATKVSLINEIGNVCKELGVDAYEVARIVGLDDRIDGQFLRSGLGWGGSCFPKDTAALIATAEEAGYDPSLLRAAVEVNEKQPERAVSLLAEHLDLAGSRVAVLGLAFKPGTDDVRNSRAVPVIRRLRDRGAEVVAYDPVAVENARERFDLAVEYADSARAALVGADGAVVATGWDEFAALDDELASVEVVVDGRRVIDGDGDYAYEGLTW